MWFILNTLRAPFTLRNPHFKTCLTSRCFSKLSQGLSTIVTFNYSFSAYHHESALLGHRRSLHPSSDWLIWPGQESKFHSLKWDTEHIWQGSRVRCNRTCSFFPVLQLQETALRTCVQASVCVCCAEYSQSLKVLRKHKLVTDSHSFNENSMYVHLKTFSSLLPCQRNIIVSLLLSWPSSLKNLLFLSLWQVPLNCGVRPAIFPSCCKNYHYTDYTDIHSPRWWSLLILEILWHLL